MEFLRRLPDESVNLCITSPPYWGLRDYGVEGQIGLEPDFRDYVRKLVRVFLELKRVLKSDGSFYLNLGDSYSHSGGAGTQYHRLKKNVRSPHPPLTTKAKEVKKMVEFQTLESEKIELATKDKITIAKKVAVGEGRRTEFIGISKLDSSGIIKQTLTLPMDVGALR